MAEPLCTIDLSKCHIDSELDNVVIPNQDISNLDQAELIRNGDVLVPNRGNPCRGLRTLPTAAMASSCMPDVVATTTPSASQIAAPSNLIRNPNGSFSVLVINTFQPTASQRSHEISDSGSGTKLTDAIGGNKENIAPHVHSCTSNNPPNSRHETNGQHRCSAPEQDLTIKDTGKPRDLTTVVSRIQNWWKSKHLKHWNVTFSKSGLAPSLDKDNDIVCISTSKGPKETVADQAELESLLSVSVPADSPVPGPSTSTSVTSCPSSDPSAECDTKGRDTHRPAGRTRSYSQCSTQVAGSSASSRRSRQSSLTSAASGRKSSCGSSSSPVPKSSTNSPPSGSCSFEPRPGPSHEPDNSLYYDLRVHCPSSLFPAIHSTSASSQQPQNSPHRQHGNLPQPANHSHGCQSNCQCPSQSGPPTQSSARCVQSHLQPRVYFSAGCSAAVLQTAAAGRQKNAATINIKRA